MLPLRDAHQLEVPIGTAVDRTPTPTTTNLAAAFEVRARERPRAAIVVGYTARAVTLVTRVQLCKRFVAPGRGERSFFCVGRRKIFFSNFSTFYIRRQSLHRFTSVVARGSFRP
jgi:hypothetical protein